MQQLIKILKALADINRLKIAKLLQNKPLCVCELEYLLPVSQSTTSNHLKVLSNASLVKSEKRGTWIVYQLQLESFPFEIQNAIKNILNHLETNNFCKISPSDQKKLKKLVANKSHNSCKL